MALIEVSHLKYRYPGTDALVLDDLSFSIEKGAFIGIVGANGAGKSTLSQAFLGLVPQFYKGAYGGTVLLNGMNTAKTPIAELIKKVGLVFQNPFHQLSGAADTVYNEVAYGLQNLGIPREEIKTRIQETLERFDMWQFREKNPFDLSGGQMQRVAIASILAMKPEILILDEPTSQLDPAGTEEVFATVDALTSSGITIIMIEQKMEKLAKYCDRLLLMAHGRLIDYDTPEKIFSREDLRDFGLEPPFSVSFAQSCGLKNPDGTYPTTPEALEAVAERCADFAKTLETNATNPFTLKKTAERYISEHAPAEIAAGETVFAIDDLHFSYDAGVEVLHGLTLPLDHRPTAIIGQNGAGKTTLVRLLKGLLKPDSGTVLYKDMNLGEKTVASLASEIGYVFQNPDDQIFKYNVLDEVKFGPLNIGMSKEDAKKAALEALRFVGLEQTASVNPYDLELHERKLVAIASVLAMNTDVIILDEPTIAQDAAGKKVLAKIVRSLAEEGRLVIAILHDMEFVSECFSRVIVMSHGSIVKDDTPDHVFRDAQAMQKAALTPPAVYSLI